MVIWDLGCAGISGEDLWVCQIRASGGCDLSIIALIARLGTFEWATRGVRYAELIGCRLSKTTSDNLTQVVRETENSESDVSSRIHRRVARYCSWYYTQRKKNYRENSDIRKNISPSIVSTMKYSSGLSESATSTAPRMIDSMGMTWYGLLFTWTW